MAERLAERVAGDDFLRGLEERWPFRQAARLDRRDDWRAMEALVLESRFVALGSLSAPGSRCFLPAYLVADPKKR